LENLLQTIETTEWENNQEIKEVKSFAQSAIPVAEGLSASLLHLACRPQTWNLLFIKCLLLLGVNPNILDSYQWTPLHWAVSKG